MNDKELNQAGGDGSTNQQALTINNHVQHNHYGPDEAQIRLIQAEIFRENMTVLAGQAAEIVMARGSEFAERLINEKLLQDPLLMAAFAEPSMQIAAYEAQKHYAKHGDVKTADLLLDLLAARARHPERSLQQIVIDESLAIVPRLTTGLLNILSALFLVNQGLRGIRSFSELQDYIVCGLEPVLHTIAIQPELFNYLKYLGCIEIMNEKKTFIDMILTKAAKLMYEGIPIDEFERNYGSIEQYKGFIEPCPNNPLVIKYAWDDFLYINEFNNNSNNEHVKGAVSGISSDYRMDINKLAALLLEIPIIEYAQHLWLSSPMINLTTTHVGALIGQAHLKHYSGLNTQSLLLE